LLEQYNRVLEAACPLKPRWKKNLPHAIADLSALFTSERRHFDAAYMQEPAFLDAYLRYFLPWNLWRLTWAIDLAGVNLSADAGEPPLLTDLGAGPLTFAQALWLARPDLRETPLEIRCVDTSRAALDAGKRLFDVLTGNKSPWKIRLVHASFTELRRERPSRLVVAANLFNELSWKISRNAPDKVAETAVRNERLMAGLGNAVFVAEPGIPWNSRYIAALRPAFQDYAWEVAAPCPSGVDVCPLDEKKWCHFIIDTAGAPAWLQRLSLEAGLPKERATVSFVYMRKERGTLPPSTDTVPIRVFSDPFSLPDGAFGRYGCASFGLALVEGREPDLRALQSGSLVRGKPDDKRRDTKSGAYIVELHDSGGR
jgi:hypothetical protein